MEVDEGGGVTAVTETYDLSLDFPNAASGGQWVGFLVFSQPVTTDDVRLKSEDKTVPYTLSVTSASNVLLARLAVAAGAPSPSVYKLEITHRAPNEDKPCLRESACLTADSPGEMDLALEAFKLEDKYVNVQQNRTVSPDCSW